MSSFVETPIGKMAYDGDAAGLQAYLRKQAQESLYFFAKTILGYKDCSPKLHQEFCHDIQSTIKIQRRGYLLPRRHFKSTIGAKSYALWRHCGGGIPDHPLGCKCETHGDPRNLRIGIFSQSEKVSLKTLKDPKWHLLHNQTLQWLFPEVIPPDVNKTKWTDSEILLPRSKSFDESSIMCFGIDQRKTGYGFDILIYDDIFDEEAANSEERAKAVQEGFDYASCLVNDPRTVEELILGTRWKYGTADVYGYIMKNLPYEGDLVTNLDDLEQLKPKRNSGFKWYVRSIVEVNAAGEEEAIFPERFTPEVIEDERKRLGEYKFACLMMNNPIPSTGVNFPPELLKEYEVRNNSEGQPCVIHPLDGTPDVPLSQLYRLSFHDPSSGGSKASCEAAIVGVGMSSDCRVFVLSDWGSTSGYALCVEKWYNLNDQYYYHDNYYEKVGSQKTIEEDIIPLRVLLGKCPYCDKRHQRLVVKPFQPPGGKDKDKRIFDFLDPTVQDKRLYLRKGMTILREQIITHPFSNLKDRLDALASGVSLLRPPSSEDEIQAEREREEAARIHSSRTHTSYEVGGYA